jgi:hypothetical protein
MTIEPTPLKPAGTIDQIFEINCVANAETRQKHLDSAMLRGLPRVVYRKKRKGKLAIVASGPSATDYVDLLKEWDGHIWGINGAFDWLRHRGIKPDAFIGIDPEEILKDYLPDPPKDVTYYLASQVHPAVFDHLKDRDVKLWFQADGQVKFPWGAVTIHGGSTCVGRAPNLAWALGWRDVHIFGGDSSFTDRIHVYDDPGLPSNAVPIDVHGRVFWTTRAMLSQACEFTEQMVEWSRGKDPLHVSLYGDGLAQHVYGQTLATGSYEQYLREAAPYMSWR